MCCSFSSKKASVQEPRSSSRSALIYHHTNDPWGDVINTCSVPATLGSAGLEVLIAEEMHSCHGSQQVYHWLQLAGACQGTLGSLFPETAGKERSHCSKWLDQGQVTLISRKIWIYFDTIVAGRKHTWNPDVINWMCPSKIHMIKP